MECRCDRQHPEGEAEATVGDVRLLRRVRDGAERLCLGTERSNWLRGAQVFMCKSF